VEVIDTSTSAPGSSATGFVSSPGHAVRSGRASMASVRRGMGLREFARSVPSAETHGNRARPYPMNVSWYPGSSTPTAAGVGTSGWKVSSMTASSSVRVVPMLRS